MRNDDISHFKGHHEKSTMQLFVIQLTLEQHGFELCRSTYRRIFFPTVNTVVLHDPWLVESMDAEWWVWTTMCKEGHL